MRGRLVFLFLKTSLLLAAADITCLYKFASDRFYLVYIIGVFEESKDGLEVIDFVFVFFQLDLLFLYGGFGFAVFLEVILGVFCR